MPREESSFLICINLQITWRDALAFSFHHTWNSSGQRLNIEASEGKLKPPGRGFGRVFVSLLLPACFFPWIIPFFHRLKHDLCACFPIWLFSLSLFLGFRPPFPTVFWTFSYGCPTSISNSLVQNWAETPLHLIPSSNSHTFGSV